MQVPIYFDTFTGSGTVSASIEFDHAEKVKLYYYPGQQTIYGEEIDPSNYNFTLMDDCTIITLEEAYLKTLANGEYTLVADLYKKGLRILTWNVQKFGEEWIIPYPGSDYDYNLITLTRGGEDVDPSNYTAEWDRGLMKILFAQEYLESLSGDYDFQAVLSFDKDHRNITLHVDRTEPSTETPPPSATPPTTAQPPTVTAPQTGDGVNALVWIIVLIASALGVCAMLVGRKHRRKTCSY